MGWKGRHRARAGKLHRVDLHEHQHLSDDHDGAECDAIAHVVRCFADPNVVHVEGSVDPARDAATIETELCLADLQAVEKRRDRTLKMTKAGGKAGEDAKSEIVLLDRLREGLDAG